MKTLYGELPDGLLVAYMDGLIGKVFKVLPMKEKKVETLDTYLNSLMRELIGCKELILVLKEDSNFLSLLNILEHLTHENNLNNYRSDVFKALDLVEKLKSSLSGDDE